MTLVGDAGKLGAEQAFATVEQIEPAVKKGVHAQVLRGVAGQAVRGGHADTDEIWRLVATGALPRLRAVWAHRKGLVVPVLASMPAIVELGAPVEELAALPAELRARLVAVTTHDPFAEAAALWERWPHLQRLTANQFNPVELVRGTPDVVRVHPNVFGLAAELERVPASVGWVEVIGNLTEARALAAAYPRLDVRAVPRRSGLITGSK